MGHDQKCTRHKKRDHNAQVRGRLNKALANGEWPSLWSNSQVFHYPTSLSESSDDCQEEIDDHLKTAYAPRIFRFEALWLTNNDCSDVIKRGWDRQFGGTFMLQWLKKLESCKKELLKWSKHQFPNNRKKINLLMEELAASQNVPDEVFDQARVDELIDKLNHMWTNEEIYWHQRSRVSWPDVGDHNSKFFQVSTVQRRQFNRIVRLKDDRNRWIEKENDIKEEIVTYFEKLFSTSGPRNWDEALDSVLKVVSDEMNDILLAPVTLEEVKGAAFSLRAHKAPGPDGYSGIFYQKFWEIVQEVVGGATLNFFETGQILSKLNSTFITLIPKVNKPESVSQFRPIGLCNFSYKILSKVLANRLKLILPQIVSSTQSAFVPERLIQDNIIVAHEVFHYLKLRKSVKEFELGLKLDMNKAFDRVEWDFLREVMLRMGFRSNWVDIIMLCVSTVSFSVLVNGKPSRSFTPSRGLRQGDPLSPFLFVLVGEVLSLMVSKACSNHRLSGIRLGRGGPIISHLFFADDSLFFLKAEVEICRELARILEAYCLASGQSVNSNKSSIIFNANAPQDLRNQICSIFGIDVKSAPGKYLGIPTQWGRSKKEALSYVKDIILQRIEGWKMGSVNQAGREVLLKQVAYSIPIYPMMCFKFPFVLCKEINEAMTKFWWGESEEGHLHSVGWSQLGLPKSSGGMGFRDLHDFNLALLAKQAWRLLDTPNTLWAQVLKSLYFPNTDFLHARKGSRASWIWYSLLEGRDALLKGALWQIGDGHSVNIWQHRWIPRLPDCRLSVDTALLDNCPSLVADLIDPVSKEWNLAPIQQLLTITEKEAIECIPLCKSGGMDKLIWPANRTSGLYTVRSGYHFLHGNRNQDSIPHGKSLQADPTV